MFRDFEMLVPTVAEHLKPFGPDIWTVEGGCVTAAAGFHYPTRMAVIRLGTDELALWSPIALTCELQQEIETLGHVAYLVPPSTLHDTFLLEWHRAYPEAEIYAPPGLRVRQPAVRFAGDLGPDAVAEWRGEIEVVLVTGNRITTEAVFFHHKSGTAIFTDLIQHFESGWFKGWRGLIAKLDLMVAAEPSVPRKFRLAFRDRAAARTALKIIKAWPTKQVLFAHGQPVMADGKAFIERAFRWLGDV